MMETQKAWYEIEGEERVDSPSLLFYADRITHNIELAISIIGEVGRLRPHVKTHKAKEVILEMMAKGITKFKCATIAEAELLALCGAPDVLLAYPLTSTKLKRFIELIANYPNTQFSCVFDNKAAVDQLANLAKQANIIIPIYLDLNVGMDRTGVMPGASAIELFVYAHTLASLKLTGLHAYDGHINHADVAVRKLLYEAAFEPVMQMRSTLQASGYENLTLVAGGSPTFALLAASEDTECGPGTFVFWDMNYRNDVPEQAFEFAALILTRVVSLPSTNKVAIDLGHKAIASEGLLNKRAFFLNAPELKPISHSEEHMVVEAPTGHTYQVGDVLYVVPYHICPTVALYSEALCFLNGKLVDTWEIVARNRKINY
jgi:D-serine deaminase-like pyridoxal phosphate-dependent protein